MSDFQAGFFDGRSPRRIDAQILLKSKGLEIRGDAGLLLAHWQYRDLQRADGSTVGALRLSCKAEKDARLVVADARALAMLHKEAPQIAQKPRRDRLIIFGALPALAAIFAGIYLGLPLASGPLSRAIPASWEAELGEGMGQIFLGEAGEKRCAGADGQAALVALTDKLRAALPEAGEFKVAVAKSEMVNAVALPGGQIVLLQALIKQAQSPDEVAGVLAHEMAHVHLRHTSKALIEQLGMRLALLFILGDIGVLADLGGELIGKSYSREAEAEADRLGIDMLRQAGILASGMAEFFRRIARSGASAMPEIFSTHPDSMSRAEWAESQPPPMPSFPAMTDEQWAALKKICD